MKKIILVVLMMALLTLSSQTLAVTADEVQKIEQAMPASPAIAPAKPRTILVFNLCNTYKHSSIPYWQQALEIMGRKTGAFKVVQSADMAVFNTESLQAFDAICFNNTTTLTPDAAQQKAILDFITSGKGIVGIHAATDNFNNWPEGAMMMGGIFKGHPWGAGGTWAFKIDEPDHPLMKPFGGKGFKLSDEIYRTLPPHYSRASQRVLMSLDMSDPATKNAEGVTPEDMDTGISWIKRVGKGRLFYCSLGHNHDLTWTTPVLEHYLAGIQYAMGDLAADDTPLGAADPSELERVQSLTQRISGYQWDQSRAALAEMEQLTREWSNEPAKLGMIEHAVVDALGSQATPAANDFYCRVLSLIGTEKSVPALTRMLEDETTFDVALYAIGRVPGKKAEAALQSALGTAKEPRRIAALITMLGTRRSSGSVAMIAEAGGHGDAVVAEAAVEALGSIGGMEALGRLQKIAGTNGQLKSRAQDAMLRCADALLRDGQVDPACQVFRSLYAASNAPLVRAGALLGLAEAGDRSAGGHVVAALAGDDPVLSKAAIKAIAQTKDKALIERAIGMAEKLPPVTQVQLVTALSENALGMGMEFAEKLTASPDRVVRLAALDALAVLGSAQSVRLLADAAAAGEDRDLRQSAQNALYSIDAAKADAGILAGINDKNISEAARVELIQAAVQRQVANSSAALLEAARSSDAKVASQAIRSLQQVSGPQDVEALTRLAVDYPSANTENALAAAALKIEDANQRASALLSQYQAGSAEAKASLLRVMGRLGDNRSTNLIRTQFGSRDPVIREAAFRAMTDWPGSDFAAALKEVAQSSPDMKMKVLAYRAYVRMLGADASALMDAYALAPRAEEQKVLIGALANCPSEQALGFVRTLSETPELKTECQMCMIGICEKLKGSNAAAAASALRELADSGSTDAVKKRASELLK